MISPSRRWLLAVFCFAGVSAFAVIKQEPIPELRPPRDEISLRTNPRDVLPWYIAGGVATMVAVLALTWPRAPRVTVPESPYARAARELPAATTAGQIEEALRGYALAAFPLPGRGQTPDELLAFLAQHPRCKPEIAALLAQFFAPIEAAKFAPATPAPALESLRAEAADILVALEEIRTAT